MLLDIILEYLPNMLSLAVINLIALISPGPDFAIIVRNSLIYSRRTALLTAFGVALGILVHVSYTLFGFGVLIKESLWLLSAIKYLGAGYLIYIGYKSLKAKKTTFNVSKTGHRIDISSTSAICTGFFTNVLNPKCVLFFIGLLSAFIAPSTPIIILLLYGILIFVETLAWFSFVTLCLSSKNTREKFNSATHWIERITGCLLMGLGIKLLFW